MSEPFEPIVIFVTVKDRGEAVRIADAVLLPCKAACVNIVNQVNSKYWWQGKLESAQECLLIIKTGRAVLSEVTEIIKSHHSYTVPEIIALPVAGGNRDYLDWIKDTVK